MNRPMIAALFMALLLVIYLAFTVNYAWILIRDASPLANAMGYALAILPVLGAWGLAAELVFARRSARLTTELETRGLLPGEELPSLTSGRVGGPHRRRKRVPGEARTPTTRGYLRCRS